MHRDGIFLMAVFVICVSVMALALNRQGETIRQLRKQLAECQSQK